MRLEGFIITSPSNRWDRQDHLTDTGRAVRSPQSQHPLYTSVDKAKQSNFYRYGATIHRAVLEIDDEVLA